MIIGQVTDYTVNITSEAQILGVAFAGPEAQTLSARVEMQNATPNASYYVRIYINGTPITPDAPITAAASTAVLQSRSFIANPGDFISLRLLGAPGDTAVIVAATIVTAAFTPAEIAAALTSFNPTTAPPPPPAAPLQPGSIAPDVLTTLQDVKTALGIADTEEDALLGLLIPEVSALIIKALKRDFVLAANPANPITEYYSGDGDSWLPLNEWPVRAPVYVGNLVAGESVILNLSGLDYIFPGQSVLGPGLAPGTVVLDLGTDSVWLSQPALASGTALPFQFGVAVYEDPGGAWGAGAWGPGTRLVEGVDYAIKRDQPDGSSSSALLCRLDGVWGDTYQRSPLALASYRTSGRGNIRVTYWAGYSTLPADLEMACILTIAKIRNSRQYGEAVASSSYNDKVASYAYTLARAPDLAWGFLSGEVGAILAQYRRLRQGRPL